MKKYAVFTVLLLLTAACLTSCGNTGGNAECGEIMAEILDMFPHRDGDAVYYQTADPADEGYISGERLGKLYCPDDAGIPDEFEKISDFCVFTAASAPDEKLFEIHIFKVRARSDRKIIEEMVSHRAHILSMPDIGSSFSGAECTVYCKYNYVFLLVTPDNRAAEKRCGDIIN